MDSFYASVEIRENPALSGLPVIIGADPMEGKGRGVVSTCSYEARSYGIHSGMPISQAYHLCPQAVFLPPIMKKYVRVSESIMQVLRDIGGEIEQVSIDEAYLNLSTDISYENAAEHAAKIKQKIRESEGLTCSVGIAPSRTYAKMASEHHKPDGLTVLPPDQVYGFLSALPVHAIPGIGKKSAQILINAGIILIGDIARIDVQILQEIFGSNAVRLKEIALGTDREGLRISGPRRSISRDHTFQVNIDDATQIMKYLDQMVMSLCQELQERNMYSRTIGIRIRNQNFHTRTKSITMIQPSRDFRILQKTINLLFSDIWTGEPVRLIGVRCSGLVRLNPVQKTLQDYF
ncbi:MAG: DNA polymerase IV [Methanomicrobiales archaeon]|nr:DNA polymerase IV [Methanomicrobiales archaeon]